MPPGETPDLSGAFPRLEQAQIRDAGGDGERRPVRAGEVLIVEGEPDDAFFVVLSGRVAVVEALGTPDAAGRPGARARPLPRRAGPAHRAARLPHDRRRRTRVRCSRCRSSGCARLVAQDPGLRRRDPAGLPGPARAGDRARGRLPDHRLPVLGRHRAAARVRRPQPAAAPVRRPGDRRRGRALLRSLGLGPRRHAGGGLAGPAAAQPVHRRTGRGDRAARPRPTAARRPAISWSSAPARPGSRRRLRRLRGPRHRGARRRRAGRAGGDVRRGSRTTSASPPGSPAASWPSAPCCRPRSSGRARSVPARRSGWSSATATTCVQLDDGGELTTRTVIVATGVRYRRLPVPRLEEFEETCVYYAATPIEAQQCVGDPVVVVGGGQLGRPGRGLPRRPRRRGPPGGPGAQPRREHVALPRRPDHAGPAHRGAPAHRGGGARRRARGRSRPSS